MGQVTVPDTIGYNATLTYRHVGSLPISGISIHFMALYDISYTIRVLPVLLLLASQVKLRPTLRTGHGGAFRGPGVATCHY